MFTLGVGTEKGSKIPFTNGYKRDSYGNEVITQLSSKSLRELASKTDGEYFEINEGVNDVERMINSINRIEGEIRDVRKIDASANKYLIFLIPALVLIFLDLIFSINVIKI